MDPLQFTFFFKDSRHVKVSRDENIFAITKTVPTELPDLKLTFVR